MLVAFKLAPRTAEDKKTGFVLLYIFVREAEWSCESGVEGREVERC